MRDFENMRQPAVRVQKKGEFRVGMRQRVDDDGMGRLLRDKISNTIREGWVTSLDPRR